MASMTTSQYGKTKSCNHVYKDHLSVNITRVRGGKNIYKCSGQNECHLEDLLGTEHSNFSSHNDLSPV